MAARDEAGMLVVQMGVDYGNEKRHQRELELCFSPEHPRFPRSRLDLRQLEWLPEYPPPTAAHPSAGYIGAGTHRALTVTRLVHRKEGATLKNGSGIMCREKKETGRIRRWQARDGYISRRQAEDCNIPIDVYLTSSTLIAVLRW